MTITKSPTGLQIDCTGPEAEMIGAALASYAGTLRLQSQTELPDESAKLFAESETCDEFANIVLRGVAGK